MVNSSSVNNKEIQFLSPENYPTNLTQLIPPLVALINQVYRQAESGMWQQGITRTNADEVQHMLHAGELIVATNEEDPVGVIKVTKSDSSIFEFGMLAVSANYRNLGLGKKLIGLAEQLAIAHKAKAMRLELLTPKHWDHPSKEFLKKWYKRLAYQPVTEEDFTTKYANLAQHLITECNFSVYHKKLTNDNSTVACKHAIKHPPSAVFED